MKKKTRDRLREIAKHSREVEINSGYVIVTQDFLSETVSIMRDAISDLVTRVMEKYPQSRI